VIRRLFGLSLALIAFGAACGGSTSGNGPPHSVVGAATATPQAQGCTPARTHASGDFDQTITVGGISRTYILHVPAGYDGTKFAPVVLAFHGVAQTGRQMLDYTRLGSLADQRGFIAVAPDGTGIPSRWNSGKSAGEPNDVEFVRNLLATISAKLCVDPDRAFAAGFDAGGGMSRVLACNLADRIAAIGTVASTSVQCIANVPMIAFHGTADPLVPFDGGPIAAQAGGGTLPPVRRSASEWSRALGCDGLPTISRPAASVELSTFTRCQLGDGDVLLYTLLGGGHTWPGAAPSPDPTGGSANVAIDATAVMWDFFVSHPLAH